MATRTATPGSRPAPSKGLALAQRFPFVAVALAAVASALGRFLDGLYREQASLHAAAQPPALAPAGEAG